MDGTRHEHDALGARELPAASLWGIHTARAQVNFGLLGRPVHPALLHAYGEVKLACARVNRRLGSWRAESAKADAIERACWELSQGALDAHFPVDALQGGAGTSTHQNVNEVLANRAQQLLGEAPGPGGSVSPSADLNLHQSTNDTFPTALRLAAIRGLRQLEEALVGLVEAFQRQEQALAGVVKVGRTQLQDAVLTTLGRSMGAFAEALGRDRWRIYKCEERLRVVNLGGTAIGTGVAAPRSFIFQACDELRALSGVGLARAENLIDATQNADAFVEVSGILKAHAATLLKISGDLRLLGSGPSAGIGELLLPPRQAGSSIMPDKVNPVIPEAVAQAAMLVFGHDLSLSLACAQGSLELNPFLPLVAHCLLESLDLLRGACESLRRHCVEDLRADEARCRELVERSAATATALVPALGYERTGALLAEARASGRSLRTVVLEAGHLDGARYDELTSAEAVCRLGWPPAAADDPAGDP